MKKERNQSGPKQSKKRTRKPRLQRDIKADSLGTISDKAADSWARLISSWAVDDADRLDREEAESTKIEIAIIKNRNARIYHARINDGEKVRSVAKRFNLPAMRVHLIVFRELDRRGRNPIEQQ
jgi:hypothetical protein